jgi:hypothetical protein
MGELPKSLLELRYSQRTPIGEIELEDRLRETLAVLDAICMGELLSAMPECEADRKRHQTAISLLDMLHDRLIEAVHDIDLGRG